MKIVDIITQSNNRELQYLASFDPISGENAPLSRFEFRLSDFPLRYYPISMKNNALIRKLLRCGSVASFCSKNKCSKEYLISVLIKLRIRHDFAYWAYQFVVIKSKEGGDNIPFYLNYPQRKTLTSLEQMRLSNTPIRMIILKARQWGGSTLVQLYMAWIQLVHRKGYYSAIVAHVNGASLKIRAMYSKFIREYPPSLLDLESDAKLELKPYEGSHTDVIIGQAGKVVRDNVICVGTMESPDNIRGGDIALAHFSEVGLWKETKGKSPSDVIRSVSSSILYKPYTMDVMESTADGENTLFHKEWLAAEEHTSKRIPIFVAWFEIEQYRIPFKSADDKKEFATNLYKNRLVNYATSVRKESDAYLWWLFTIGASLESINWYVVKRSEFTEHASMAAEFPSDPIEAFKHSGTKVFDRYKVELLRPDCREPIAIGDLRAKASEGLKALVGVKFVPDAEGSFKIWEMPDLSFRCSDRYVVSTDVGGRSSSADYSVIVVIDRWWRSQGEGDAIVAQWRGHIRHDLLAWRMAQVAQFYCNALLVVESNTFETKDNDTEGDHADFILNQIADAYPNMYARESPADAIREGLPARWGFHTNRSTKNLIIDNLVALVEEREYTERDADALAEFNAYDRIGDKMGASEGYHDDMLMARAIGLYISSTLPIPREIVSKQNNKSGSASVAAINESSL